MGISHYFEFDSKITHYSPFLDSSKPKTLLFRLKSTIHKSPDQFLRKKSHSNIRFQERDCHGKATKKTGKRKKAVGTELSPGPDLPGPHSPDGKAESRL